MMSAYMVDKKHVTYLVAAATSHRLRFQTEKMSWFHDDHWHDVYDYDKERLVEVAQMLWDENRKSIECRYPDTVENFDNAPGPIGESFRITSRDFRHPWLDIDPVQVLKSCHCFAYQACEHDGWKKSEAKAFIDSLEGDAVNALTGYDDAQWGAPAKDAPRLAVILT